MKYNLEGQIFHVGLINYEKINKKFRIIIHVIQKQLYRTENTLIFSYKANRLSKYSSDTK